MKIIIATDGSSFSQAAVKKCCQMIANREDTAIKIISVYQTVVPADIFVASVQYSPELEEALRTQAEGFVEKGAAAVREYFAGSNLDLSTQVMIGIPSQVIIEMAEEWKADLIVVGSHGRGFWGRVLIGSVTDAVLHHAPCSVLVIRQTKDFSENMQLE